MFRNDVLWEEHFSRVCVHWNSCVCSAGIFGARVVLIVVNIGFLQVPMCCVWCPFTVCGVHVLCCLVFMWCVWCQCAGCVVHVLCVVSMCSVWCPCAVCGVHVLCVMPMCCNSCIFITLPFLVLLHKEI